MTVAPYRTIEEVGISQIRRHLKTIMWSWWPWVVGIALVLRIAIAIYDEFDASMWAAGVSVSPVFLSVIGVIAGGIVMPRFIANGVTRMQFATAALALILSTASLAALITVVGFGVEEIIYNLAGKHHVLTDPVVYDSIPRAMAVFASYFLLNAVYMVAGWTAGLGFYRWS